MSFVIPTSPWQVGYWQSGWAPPGVSNPIDTLVTAPAQPAVSLAYARSHLRALSHDEDELVVSWIQAATALIEMRTFRQIVTATRELWIDAFPPGERIELPRSPLQDVEAVLYVDSTGAVVPFTDGASPETRYFQVWAPTGEIPPRGWIAPIAGQSWPTARAERSAVRVRYRAGFADDPDHVPELLRGAICFLVAHFDQNRSAVDEARRGSVMEMPLGVQAILDQYGYSNYPSQAWR